MARPKAIETANRDMRIQQLHEQGYRYRDIAEMEGISVSRISQIITRSDLNVPDEESRAKIHSQMESLYYDTLEPIRHGPGQVLFASGTGNVIIDPRTGKPAEDLRFRLEVVKKELEVLQALAKLGAIEKQKPQVTEEKQTDTTILDRIMEERETIMQQLHDYKAKIELYEAGNIVEADVVDRPAVGRFPAAIDLRSREEIPSPVLSMKTSPPETGRLARNIMI